MQDVGSTTTIVVEMLKAANVPITDAEATLFAIGIHADTGPSGRLPRGAHAHVSLRRTYHRPLPP